MSFRFIPILIIALFSCTPEPSESASPWQDDENRKNVAFLIMDGTFNSELTAPFDILHHTRYRDGIDGLDVFTIAEDSGPVTTFEGLRIQPDFRFTDDEHPDIDILVVAAAENHLGTDLENARLVEFVRKTAKECEYVISLCDGAFLLAEAGVLDNHVCTTFPGDVEELRKRFPDLDVREDVLWVHHNSIITGAGGAKSFEPAMYLVELLYGREVATENGKGMVIDWQPDSLKWIRIE